MILKTKFMFAWFDAWVGFFWDDAKSRLYFFPVPMFGVAIDFDRAKLVPWLYKWGPLQRIYAPCDPECYFTRVKLMPHTPWGQWYLHIFHKGEPNVEPHDHAYPFQTILLFQGYTEEVWGGPQRTECSYVHVAPWRVHTRPADHCHRICQVDKGFPMLTLFRQGQDERAWGYWAAGKFTGWKQHLFGKRC